VNGYTGYPEAGEFTVAERIESLPSFPCSNCHQALPVNTQPRENPFHPALRHGTAGSGA